MKFEKYKYKGVAPDGTVEDGGAVFTKGGIYIGVGKGCDQFSITVTMPRTEGGIVEGIKVTFDSRAEMLRALLAVRNM